MAHKLALAYIHPGHVKAEFMDSVIRTLQDPRFDVTVGRKQSNTIVQVARNDMARFFVDSTDCEHLLFVDADVEWKPDDVQALLDMDVPIASGLYLGIRDGRAFPVAHLWTTPDKHYGVNAEGKMTREMRHEDITDGVVEVAGVGMGFCLIRRDVMKTLVEGKSPLEHWSCYPFAVGQTRVASGHYMFLGEDITFCVRASQHGFGTFLACDVMIGHAKEFLIYPDGAKARMESDEAPKELELR